MSETKGNKGQNPSGIWQAIWVDLIKTINENLITGTANTFRIAWRSLLVLQKTIPPQCIEDTKEEYKKAKETMDFKSYNKDKQLEIDAPYALREVLGAVIFSLFDRGWINKDFGIKPKFDGGGEL